MADRVDRVLERDLHGLDLLRQHEALTDAELRSIVNRRRDFEYKLHRRAPIVTDFQRAIQYETNLYKLVELRITRLHLKNRDHLLASIRRREFGLYQRMVGKFPGDHQLWATFLDYARNVGAKKALSKVIAQALQLHPLQQELWVKSMAFEFDVNNSVEAARVLMQRALRMLPKSHMIWLAFFKMELQYARKLIERAKLSSQDVIVGMDVPLLLYRHACQAIGGDWRFRFRFLQMVADDDGCDDLRAQIRRHLQSEFAGNDDCMEAVKQLDSVVRAEPEPVQWCIDTNPISDPIQV